MSSILGTGKRLILSALRYGPYVQGNNQLRYTQDDQDYHCCLGVICDVMAPDNWQPAKPDGLGQYYKDGTFLHVSIVPITDAEGTDDAGDDPDNVSVYIPDAALLDSLLLTPKQARDLAGLNDDLHATFDDIANLLESYWATVDELMDESERRVIWEALENHLSIILHQRAED